MLFGGGTVFGAGQPCSSQYSASRVTVAVILENLDVIGAPSTVSRRADKTARADNTELASLLAY